MKLYAPIPGTTLQVKVSCLSLQYRSSQFWRRSRSRMKRRSARILLLEDNNTQTQVRYLDTYTLVDVPLILSILSILSSSPSSSTLLLYSSRPHSIRVPGIDRESRSVLPSSIELRFRLSQPLSYSPSFFTSPLLSSPLSYLYLYYFHISCISSVFSLHFLSYFRRNHGAHQHCVNVHLFCGVNAPGYRSP